VLPTGVPKERVEVTSAAERLGLSAIYVPSMRNGRPGATTEDRGNAILSSVRLSDVTAIELPLERQRRVAIAATVMVKGGEQGVQPVRLVCTHFTNMVMHHAWILSESGRLRQARALALALPAEGSLILGGDLNSWFGYRDSAYRQLAGTMARASAEDRRPTFGPLRLDHVLFRLPTGWRTEVRRAEQKYGSDHYPLAATIDAPQ
jgi:endonuclease/exonuclease/phosphatase family metal-dependent hydrolase